MKTAMQELIEYTENLKSTYDFSFDKFFAKASELLEKEKEQIIDANQKGWQTCRKDLDQTAEQYYNETFNDHE